MAIDVDALLAPVSEESPAGEDLSYDAERQEIESAFESSVSVESSGEDETNWRDVIGKITGQAARTKDIWLAVYLARAGARNGDADTVEAGCQFLAGMLENFWPSVHPQLEEYGYQGRKGPCESLTRTGEFLRPLRRMALLRHPRLGDYSGEDFERFAAGGAAEDGYGMFRAALEGSEDGAIDALVAQLDRIRAAIQRADVVLTANAEGDTGTNFTPTYAAIDSLRQAVASFGSVPEATGDTAQSAGTASAGMADGGSQPSFSAGRIESREDVVRAIDAVIDYYQRREPGSPLPVLLVRAREWVSADFLSILEDISPSGVDDVRRVLVSQRQ